MIEGISQIGGGLFHAFTPVQSFGALGQHPNLAVQVIPQVLHQVFAPHRLPSVHRISGFRGGKAVLQPLLRIQVAPGAVIYLLNNLGHQPVIPSQALGIREGPEIPVLRPGLVGPVQKVRKHRVPDLPALVFVRHPEIRGNVQLIGILPQHIGTEAVNGGDFCQEQPLHLLL